MTSVNTQQTNFTSGELSPKLRGRSDLQAYFNGANRVENFVIEMAGGATFRAGTQFVAETKDNAKPFLYKFQFSDIQAYMLEFTAGNIRIYKDRGVVELVGSPVDVSTPYTLSELFELKFTQSATELYIVHPNHNPRTLTRSSDTSWTIALHAPTGLSPAFAADDYPSCATFYENRLIYGASNNNPETLWFSVSADPDDFTVGTSATDGIKYTVANGEGTNNIEWIRGTQEMLVIGGFSDLLKATGGEGETAISPSSISIKPTNTVGSADINPISAEQYVGFVQRNGLTIRTFEYLALETLYSPVDRNLIAEHITKSGITQIVNQKGRPTVMWATKSNGELIGLTFERRQEVVAWHRHSTDGNVISVTSTPRTTDHDDLWLAVERDGNYYIEYLNDQIELPDFEDFVTGDKVNDNATYLRAMQEAQKEYIHMDSALTYDGSEVTAGITISPAALSGVGVTFTASSAVFSAGDVGREIWVKSEDGTNYGRAEITAYTSTTVVDCDIILDFDSTDTVDEWYLTTDEVTGIDHLEGYDVRIVTDGSLHPDMTVTSGAVALDYQASKVHVGLGYIGRVETMDLEGGGRKGTAQTKKKSIVEIGFRLLKTIGLAWGTDYYKLEPKLIRAARDSMDNPPEPFTGDDIIRPQSTGGDNIAGWSRNKRVIFEQSTPFPAVVQMVVPYFNTAE